LRNRTLLRSIAGTILLGCIVAVVWAVNSDERSDAARQTRVAEPRSETNRAPPPRDPIPTRAHVVVDEAGRGVAGAIVLRCPWGENPAGGVLALVRDGTRFECDERGQFPVPIEPETERAAWVVIAEGYGVLARLSTRPAERIVLKVSRPLQVEVRLDDEPCAGARIVWSGNIAKNVRASFEAVSGESGTAEVVGVVGGTVHVKLPVKGIRSQWRGVEGERMVFEFARYHGVVVHDANGDEDFDSNIALVVRQTGLVWLAHKGPVAQFFDEDFGRRGLDAVAWSNGSAPVRQEITAADGTITAQFPLVIRLEERDVPRLTVVLAGTRSRGNERVQVDLEFDDTLFETDGAVIASRSGTLPGEVEFANLTTARLRGRVRAGDVTLAFFEVDADQETVECEVSPSGALAIADEAGKPPVSGVVFTIGNLDRTLWQVVRDYHGPLELPSGEYWICTGHYQRSEVVSRHAATSFSIRSGQTTHVRVDRPKPVRCVVRVRGGILNAVAGPVFKLEFIPLDHSGLPAWHRSRSKAEECESFNSIETTRVRLRKGITVRLTPGLYRAELRCPAGIDSSPCRIEATEKQVVVLDYPPGNRAVRVVHTGTGRGIGGATVMVSMRDGHWAHRQTDTSGRVTVPEYSHGRVTIDVTAGTYRTSVEGPGAAEETVIPLGPVAFDSSSGTRVRVRLRAPAGSRMRSVAVSVLRVETVDSTPALHRLVRSTNLPMGDRDVTDWFAIPAAGRVRLQLRVYDRMDLEGSLEFDAGQVPPNTTLPVELTER